MNAFFCSAKSYLEVSSRDYLVASDKPLLFGSYFKNPGKGQKLRGKKFLKKTSFQVGMDLQKVKKQGRDEKNLQHSPHYETMVASNAVHLHS